MGATMRLRRPTSDFVFLGIIFFLELIILQNFLRTGYPPSWGGDSYGHLFKIWKLMRGYHPWIEDWYGGYPFLRFYPPLTYYLGALLGVLSGSAIWGYKLSVFLAFIMGAFSMRFLLRELGFSDVSSYAASLVYAFAPYHLRILSPEGNFPRFIGINLAPLLVLASIYLLNGDKKKAITAGVLVSVVLLSHHTLVVTFGLSLLLLIPYLLTGRTQNARGITMNLLIAGGTSFLLSAFWLLPFLFERANAHFLKENSILYLFRLQSVRLSDVLFPGDPWSLYQGTLLYFGILGSLLAIFRAEKKGKLFGISVLIGIVIPVLFSLGYYGPSPWLNKLPVFNMIPPYRWLDPVEFSAAVGLALLFEYVLRETASSAPSVKKVAPVLLIILVVFSLSDVRLRMGSLKSEEFPGDYLAVLNYIGNDNETGWRYIQWGPGITQGSRIAYTPALTEKPTLDGWYRQGDPAYPQHAYLNYAIAHDPTFAEKALQEYSVKYVIVDSNFRDARRGEDNLKSLGFREVYSAGSFKLYSWSNWSFLSPKANVLVIGSWPLNLGIEYEKGSFIDDYVDSLGKYSLIILNGYKYRDPLVWKKLEEYVKNGGILVVNTFRSPDAEALRLGVKSVVVRVSGKLNLSSSIYNVSLFSNFTYEGKPWTATAYRGNITSLIKLGNLTVLGFRDYGRGRVYFIGLNLPYHAVYTKNEYESEILLNLISDYVRVPKLSYRILNLGDGEITIHYTAERSTAAILSENFYPHWRAYVDGKEIEVSRDKEFGLILLYLPAGDHELKLRFRDPYFPLRYLSLGTLIIILLLFSWIPKL